jgi:hypothetical protein
VPLLLPAFRTNTLPLLAVFLAFNAACFGISLQAGVDIGPVRVALTDRVHAVIL